MSDKAPEVKRATYQTMMKAPSIKNVLTEQKRKKKAREAAIRANEITRKLRKRYK